MALDYKKSGVDVSAGDALVDWLKRSSPKTGPHKERIVAGIGGFAALFKADFGKMKDPCLVACTDGVGTKVKLAAQFGRYREVAQDLVAMCANDLACSGATPLFFLDYYATGKLDLKAAKGFLAGIREACHACSMALVGGETAEMPGVYQGKDFDCAGFAVGVVDREKVLGPHLVREGDVVLGVSSSGFHSNGYSLLRKVFHRDLKKWADELCTPTALYVELVRKMLLTEGLHAVAHITGGGFDNIPRVLPAAVRVQLSGWQLRRADSEVMRRAKLSYSKMLETLNCGVGLVVVVKPSVEREVRDLIEDCGFRVVTSGLVERRGGPRSRQWQVALEEMRMLDSKVFAAQPKMRGKRR